MRTSLLVLVGEGFPLPCLRSRHLPIDKKQAFTDIQFNIFALQRREMTRLVFGGGKCGGFLCRVYKGKRWAYRNVWEGGMLTDEG